MGMKKNQLQILLMKDIITDELNNQDQVKLGAAEGRMNEVEESAGNVTLSTHTKDFQNERKLLRNVGLRDTNTRLIG